MSRLIVISNRVSAATGELSGAQGGLSVALSAALREYRGLWFGWSGKQTDEFNGQINFHREEGVTTATVDLEEQDIEEYYNGYANRTLWPLFHYRIDLAEYEREFAHGYQRANERFAETVCPLIEPDDVVWIQDYHMIPLADDLRKQGCQNPMGFFLHIPWPPHRLLVTLPEAYELAKSMFAYDVVGFQTQEWVDTFREYAEAELGAEYRDGYLHAFGRSVRLLACPIGIDSRGYADLSVSPGATAMAESMLASANDRKMIIGVDRLDYSKGLEERFLGYERFLTDNPEVRKEVFLLQIAPPSREAVTSYQKIRQTLDSLSGRINGEHADVDWVPIRYVNQNYTREHLAGLYRTAKIALVTPLRDGMNLVAKEFVAAQDPKDPGVLILSRFAGAAEQLKDALLVNPHSAEEISDALVKALNMPLQERIARWKKMKSIIDEQDVVWWRQRFTDALLSVKADTKSEAPALV